MVDEHGRMIVATTPVPGVVDATGAGDCLNGVLAASVAEGVTPRAGALARAVHAASLSVTKAGAREGMPFRSEIDRPRAGPLPPRS